MSRTRPSALLLTALRRDRPTAWLAALLLLGQLFLAGFGTAAMAAASAGDPGLLVCSGETGGVHRAGHPAGGDHGAVCPCLAAGCCPAAAIAPSAGEGGAAWPRPTFAPATPRPDAGDGPERRPLALFARAGRSPPTLS